MIKILIKWVVLALVVMLTAFLIPGIEVTNFLAALIATAVIVLCNIFIKPVVQFLTLPINLMTLGLFTLVINAVLFWFTGYVVDGFNVDGFLSALFGSIILSIMSVGIAKV